MSVVAIDVVPALTSDVALSMRVSQNSPSAPPKGAATTDETPRDHEVLGARLAITNKIEHRHAIEASTEREPRARRRG